MESINNDKAGITTASYFCNDCADKNSISPFPPYSPVRHMSRKGTGRHKGAVRSWHDHWISDHNGLRALAQWSTGLYSLGASSSGKLHQEGHCGLTASQILLFHGKCRVLNVGCWPWMVWELLYWSESDHITRQQSLVSAMASFWV